MAIAENAAAPGTNPTTATGSSPATLTTGTFSPPANSLVIAMCALGWGSAAGTITVTDSSDSNTTNWSKTGQSGPGGDYGNATVAYRYFTAAPGSITVKATFTNLAAGRFIYIKTLTGVDPVTPVGGTKVSQKSTTSTYTTSITTTTVGSYVAGVGDCNTQGSSSTYTAAALSTVLGSFWAGSTDGVGMAAFKQTALTSTPGATTLGFTTSSSPGALALVEFLPTGAGPPPTTTADIAYQVQIDWGGDGSFTTAGDDVTLRTLTRSPVLTAFGRDQVRAGTPVRPGTANFELNNVSRDYSPENVSSPLVGLVGPGREVLIKATAFAATYTIYRGWTDDYDVIPGIEDKSVQIGCLDTLGSIAQTTISTALYQGIRTGEAIGVILDECGWPAARRDLDLGATVLQFWWEEGADGAAAVDRVLACEGFTSTVFVDVNGNFCFRDRHSRLTRASSATSQATFRTTETDPEPIMSPPFTYNGGWRDIINSITYSVDERTVTDLVSIWQSDAVYALAASEVKVIRVEGSDPFMNAIVPVQDTLGDGSGDYTLLSGSVTSVSLSRTSGATTDITITAGGGGATITSLQLRAQSVYVINTIKVTAEDATSITRYGIRSGTLDMPFASTPDATAVATIMLGHRAQRLPIVSFRMISKNSGRIAQQLGRDLLDRITIIEPETGLNADFWIEQIQHSFTAVFHETTFGCEKIPAIGTGVSDPATIFQFDAGAGHRFDEGKFCW